MHPWIVSTENELKIPYLITLGLVEFLFSHVVDIVKMELVKARTIKRDGVDNDLVFLMGLMLVVVLMFVLVLMLVVILVLLVDKTKGIPLIEDALAFSVRSERNKMKTLSCIFKHRFRLSMILKTRGGSREFHKRMFNIYILHRTREENFFYQDNTKYEDEDLWRMDNDRRRGGVRVQKGKCL